MPTLPNQWAEAMREAQAALYAACQAAPEGTPERKRAWDAAEKLTAALMDDGAGTTANALVGVYLAAQQAYRDLTAVGACVAGKLDTLENTPSLYLAEHVEAIRHGLEHVRDAATLILKALASDDGPGREIEATNRYFRTVLAGLLQKDRKDFDMREAVQELGQAHYRMRERIQLAERGSVYIAWLERLAYLLADGTAVPNARAKAALYAQAARGYMDGRHPAADVLDHPLMRDPGREPEPSASPPGTGGQASPEKK